MTNENRCFPWILAALIIFNLMAAWFSGYAMGRADGIRETLAVFKGEKP
jgi:hypothetical protein